MLLSKKILPFLLLFLLLGHATLAAEEMEPQVWSVKTAISFALSHNPDSQIAAQRLSEARAMLDKALAGDYPQVILSSSYTWTDNPLYSFGNIINQAAITPSTDFNKPGSSDNLNLKAEARYRIYDGGQRGFYQQAANNGIEAAAQQQQAVLHQLGFEVFRSFERISEAQSLYRARQVALEALTASVAVAQARFDAGEMLKIDLLNLEVQQLSAEENLIRAEQNLELAKKIFAHLLGLENRSITIVAERDLPAVPPAGFALKNRPELQSLRAALAAAEAQVAAAKGARLPSIDGFGSYQMDRGFKLDGDSQSWLAGVRVDFTLFDGHTNRAEIALAEARRQRLRAELRKRELAVDLELSQAELMLHQAQLRLQVTTKMVEQAQESVDLSRARFREGVILSSDLIDSETRLTEAQVRQAVANSALRLAAADVRRAAGFFPFAD
jgi:outer membrane protein TolC